jgi:hypothetical protein
MSTKSIAEMTAAMKRRGWNVKFQRNALTRQWTAIASNSSLDTDAISRGATKVDALFPLYMDATA